MHRKRRFPESMRHPEGPTEAKQKCLRDEKPKAKGMSLRIPLRTVYMHLNILRLNNTLCDWIIKTNDNKEMAAHGAILSLASPYFQLQFSNNWKEGGLNLKHTINVDLSAQIMQQILNFSYTGKVKLTEENVHQILVAADQFLFYDIVQECYQFIMKSLRMENCIARYQLTKPYLPLELSNNLTKYVCHNFREIMHLSLKTFDLTIEELQNILNSDDLSIAEEQSLFNFVLRWIDHDATGREQHILTLLKCLRFGRMDINFFIGTVMTNRFVERIPSVKEYLNEAERFFTSLEYLDCNINMTHPLARQRISNDVLLVFGGWKGHFKRNSSFIEVFDKCAARWFPMNCIGTPNEREFYYHGVCVMDNIIYMVGGCCDSVTWSTTSKVHCFDPVKKAWGERACMYEARSNVSVVAMDGLMYAIGGFDRFFNLDSAERYDPRTNQWFKIASMHDCRSEAGAAVLHGKIYIAGGFATDDVLQSVEVYDPVCNQWTLLAPMSSPRYGLCLVSYQNAIYAMGGSDGMGNIESVERYEPINSQHWTSVKEMTTSRKDFAAVVLDDKIHAIGGTDDWTKVPSMEWYDEVSGQWSLGPHLSQTRCGLAACVLTGLENAREYSYAAFHAKEEEDHARERTGHSSSNDTV